MGSSRDDDPTQSLDSDAGGMHDNSQLGTDPEAIGSDLVNPLSTPQSTFWSAANGRACAFCPSPGCNE